ncbi:putative uncharacterized protein DDB_G0282133 [Aricia agestis]|uniref:putative uncharacterized protein DDB_G0282133 n=1 Tax=Aricia agestis TaxID=91739 RepID=UPI001C2036E6|nr:putative uncharacterized protein DDB_G0282133 [Aricia agestis]
MSRRNHYYNNYGNFSQHEQYPNYHYGAYQTEPYENDGNNYYTNGNITRRTNSNAFRNWQYQNQNYGGFATYDNNMQYSNWEYRNYMNHANQWDRRNRISNDNTNLRSNNYSHNSSPNFPSDRKFVSKFSNNNSSQAKKSAGVFSNNNSNQAKQSAGVFSNNNSNQTKQSAGIFSNSNSNEAKQSAGVHDKDSIKNTICREVDKNLENIERPTTRIISKKSLSEGTENPKYEQTEPYSYTDYWLKGREGDVKSPLVEEFEEPEDPCYVLETRQRKKFKNTTNKKQNKELKATKFEKKAKKIFTTPVEMSKGKSLLEKMGWKGGGLGKDGSGIVEPVTPNMSYVGATLGLGQATEEDDDLHFTDRTYLRTLKVILEFVKNDLENELKFDTRLTPMERKRIHRTVQEMRDGVEKFPEPYKSVIRDICYHNHYELYTESEGFKKSRHLNLYKEPNDHMYIVVPEDLNEEENVNVACKKTKNTKSNNGTGTAESDIISAENEVKENNVSTEDNSDVVTTQFIEQNVISIEEENNVSLIGTETKVLENNEAINHENIFFVKVDNTDNEVLDKDCQKNIYTSNEEQIQTHLQDTCDIKNELSGQENDKVSNQEKNSYTENDVPNKNSHEYSLKVTENLQGSVHSVPKIESNSNIDKNSTAVKPDTKNITKKQIARLNAEKKKKEKKIKAKHIVIHIEKKENNKREDNEILDTIIKYFVEYTQDPLVTEFRFLGPFDYKERKAIDTFFKVCKGIHNIDRSREVLDLFDCKEFYLEVRQDNNGSDVIFKISKERDSSVNK